MELSELTAALEAYTQSTILPAINAAVSGSATKFDKRFDSLSALLEASKAAPAPAPQQAAQPSEQQQLSQTPALTARVAELEALVVAQNAVAAKNRLGTALGVVASSKGLQHVPTFTKLFSSDYGDDLREVDGEWFVGDTPLTTAVDVFTKTEDGSIFLPPSGVQGSGSKPSDGKPVSKPPDFNATVTAAFSR